MPKLEEARFYCSLLEPEAMDVARLTTFLSPLLPMLLQSDQSPGGMVSEATAVPLGDESRHQAQAIWHLLSPKVKAKATAWEAVMDVIHSPQDQDLQAVLRVQLKKVLEQDPELAGAIAQLMQTAPSHPTSITQTVIGNQNQVINRVSGGQVFGHVSGPVIFGSGSASPPAVSTAVPPRRKTILILAANPKRTSSLRLGEEVREIRKGLERSQGRDRFVITERWAVTPTDVRRALLDCQPHIVHFSGHGVGSETPLLDSGQSRALSPVPEANSEPEGLVFETINGDPQLVSGEAIAALFSLFQSHIECVVLNACYSETQARAIKQHIPYVVGMRRAINDQAAIEFSVGFYDALLAEKSVEFAYQLGCNAIQMAGIPEALTPILYH